MENHSGVFFQDLDFDMRSERRNWSVEENETTSWENVTDLNEDIILQGIEAAILGGLILTTVVGNVFVIAAVVMERHLQTAQNQLIISLAVADLLIACLVMPLGAVYEIRKEWSLGPELCDVWTSSDVLCCTASILHLVAIAADSTASNASIVRSLTNSPESGRGSLDRQGANEGLGGTVDVPLGRKRERERERERL
ncbi:unnamed protein product [Darwinula stevensoni]|uniref:G-protein coupled receptors family 1 profile domain-containing protein n=1 Tax=Darwinula stevensoni TaxID=69355 RepID=A0A7R9FSX3_9CRUS|nr:unnamed protein product [Darwinula stevensoni]CAG0904022.1 unnamed protein product [Darwinula stevensoni]